MNISLQLAWRFGEEALDAFTMKWMLDIITFGNRVLAFALELDLSGDGGLPRFMFVS